MLNAAQRSELEEQYGAFYVGLLGEVLRLFDDVESRRFTANEAAALAKSRFCGLMQERDPDCRERVTAFQERITAEKAELTRIAAAYEEKRQAAIAGEKLRLEQEAKDRNAEIYANAREAERRQQEQWKQRYDEEEKLRRERNEKDRLDAEAAAKAGARLLTEIETSGKGK